MLAAGRAGEEAAAPFAAAAPGGRAGRGLHAARPRRSPTTGTTTCSWATPATRRCWTARAFAPDDPERALLAQIAGNEVAGRLGAALFLGPHNGQFWSSIHCGGAAAAAGVALGFDAERLAHAIAISLYQPPYGLWPGFMGPATKLLTAAEPAAQGARAALLAAEGVRGPLDVIENPRGLLTHLAFVRRPAMLGGLGARLAHRHARLQAAARAAPISRRRSRRRSAPRCRRRRRRRSTSRRASSPWRWRSWHPRGAPTPVGVNFSAARSVAIALIAGRLTHEELDPAWLSEHRADVEELAARVRVRHDWELTLETLRGTGRRRRVHGGRGL